MKFKTENMLEVVEEAISNQGYSSIEELDQAVIVGPGSNQEVRLLPIPLRDQTSILIFMSQLAGQDKSVPDNGYRGDRILLQFKNFDRLYRDEYGVWELMKQSVTS